jgi:hypothetical protein
MAQISKEKLHSRRQFFKKAAKGMLPILGTIALSNNRARTNQVRRL